MSHALHAARWVRLEAPALIARHRARVPAFGVTEIADWLDACWQSEAAGLRGENIGALVTLERDRVPALASVVNFHLAPKTSHRFGIGQQPAILASGAMETTTTQWNRRVVCARPRKKLWAVLLRRVRLRRRRMARERAQMAAPLVLICTRPRAERAPARLGREVGRRQNHSRGLAMARTADWELVANAGALKSVGSRLVLASWLIIVVDVDIVVLTAPIFRKRLDCCHGPRMWHPQVIEQVVPMLDLVNSAAASEDVEGQACTRRGNDSSILKSDKSIAGPGADQRKNDNVVLREVMARIWSDNSEDETIVIHDFASRRTSSP